MILYYSFDISPRAILLFGIALAALMYIVLVYLYRLRVVRRCRRICDMADEETEFVIGMPPVSVVVYANGEGEALMQNLPYILEQEYMGRFEVIVVNDGKESQTEDAVTRLHSKYDNISSTFVPDDARAPRKKMAITLGVKAARNEIIVLTDATTRVGGKTWLNDMVAPFGNEQTQVVIGYNTPCMDGGRQTPNIVRVYDYIEDAVTWLSAAINRHAYRGLSSNLAYRREVFFNNKGFFRSLNLNAGDDDLFVNEITNADNTYVQLSAPSIGEEGCGVDINRRLCEDRRNRVVTSSEQPHLYRGLMALGEWLMWVMAAAALYGAKQCGAHNIVGWSAAALMIIVMMAWVMMAWRKTIINIGGPKLMWSLLWLVPFRPVRNIWHRLHRK